MAPRPPERVNCCLIISPSHAEPLSKSRSPLLVYRVIYTRIHLFDRLACVFSDALKDEIGLVAC